MKCFNGCRAFLLRLLSCAKKYRDPFLLSDQSDYLERVYPSSKRKWSRTLTSELGQTITFQRIDGIPRSYRKPCILCTKQRLPHFSFSHYIWNSDLMKQMSRLIIYSGNIWAGVLFHTHIQLHAFEVREMLRLSLPRKLRSGCCRAVVIRLLLPSKAHRFCFIDSRLFGLHEYSLLAK